MVVYFRAVGKLPLFLRLNQFNTFEFHAEYARLPLSYLLLFFSFEVALNELLNGRLYHRFQMFSFLLKGIVNH